MTRPADPKCVRPAQTRDLDRVAALWTAITDHHRNFDPLFTMRPDADASVRDLLAAMHRDPETLILVYDEAGDLPAMLIVRVDQSPPILHETQRAEITDVGVRESERRRGIAGVLVDVGLEWVRISGVERVEVSVAKGNVEGQAFWRSRGFGDLMDVLHLRM
ncbi:MAG: GNAT family N-acetyltransferase [bacterium]|nr:GNAT family N-acetyltransferase [bacterium]